MKRFISLVLVAVLVLAVTVPVLAEKKGKPKTPNSNKPVTREEFNSSLSSLLEEFGYSWEPVKGKKNITREDMVIILGELLIDEDIIDENLIDLPFKDIKNMNKNTKEKLKALYNENIMEGKTKHTFNLNSKVTYGELKKVLERVRKVLEWEKDKCDRNTIPFKVKDIVDSRKGTEGIVVKKDEDKIIVSITKKFGTPGYDMDINRISRVGNRYEIDLSIISPDKDAILPQVITYLTANIEIDEKYLEKTPYRFYIEERIKEKEIKKEIPFKQLKIEDSYNGKEGIVVKEEKGKIFLAITKRFSTPGYAMAVEKIIYKDGEYKVHLIVVPPKKNAILPQVIKYRTINLEIDKDDIGKPPYDFVWQVLPIKL
ncbi:S-layer homology domain-containing protein [Schnuerera sp.]|uniref:S-layer homology domain-containing protein n=1 Tax=Schnuerera sp. TaxID=2794844 RepID=UPI002BFEE3FD|nr:S-layer homology domain-containing protein [Schnuerera sp.]HSH35773.1 S-layer homology domain-containing protein [Schnuerera sp.]